MFDVAGLSFDYSDDYVFHDVNFSLEPGCLLHVRGKNGAGKTTLLKLLAGLLHPTDGEIRFRGDSIWDNITDYQRLICYVGHKSGVSQALTVREQVYFDLKQTSDSPDFDVLIKRFALEGLDDTLCGLLSAGQRRRVGLLRTVMSNALVWFLDEPLVALDDDAVTILMSCISEHLEKGGQIILTSHQPLPNRCDQECWL